MSDVPARPQAATPLGRFWAEFRESRVAVVALAVVAVLVGLAILAPLIAPQDPYDLSSLSLMDARRPPGFVGSGGLLPSFNPSLSPFLLLYPLQFSY